MKITTDTPDLLIIDYLPWRMIWVWLMFMLIWGVPGVIIILGGAFWMGMAFLVFGGCLPWALGVFLFERSQLVMNRTTNTAEIRRRSLWAYTRLPLDLSDIEKLSTPGKTDDTRGFLTIHITGGMDAGSHTLNTIRARHYLLDRVATRANAWLAQC